MRLGYASLTRGVRDQKLKTCILKNANEENLLKLIAHNLKTLDKIIDYNIENEIKLFRISSDIIPFASSPINKLLWWEIFEEELTAIGLKIEKNKIRVSMHPGQYTVLNSLDKDVVSRAILDLEYHNRFLNSLKTNKTNKIILHIGGVYGDKDSAIKRFVKNYQQLDQGIKDRLVVENDDVSYNIEDLLYISEILKIPVVYDNLHNKVLNSPSLKPDAYWIDKAKKTWDKSDGRQKLHYSQQNNNKRAGAHSETIFIGQFVDFVNSIQDQKLDIMLEVKDKNLSTIKAINVLKRNHIKYLESEWSKYKYTILEKSPQNYNKIREMLKDKKGYPAIAFYEIIEESLFLETKLGHAVNGFDHVWGYFKNLATNTEKNQYTKLIQAYQKGTKTNKQVKNFLKRLAIKYQEDYLLKSYYFDL